MKLCYRIWLDQNGKVFGSGPYQLLKNVEETGSLAEAAKKMKMSYNKAFTLIRDIENRLGYELLESKRGGADRGGSKITENAFTLMKQYEGFMQECDGVMKELYEKYFGQKDLSADKKKDAE